VTGTLSTGLRDGEGNLMAAPATVELPSGVVTFVFTDIEGSTRLLHRLGDRYADVLERHREILRQAWAENAGHEVDAHGDDSLVVFSSVDDAIAACVDARRALAAERWPERVEVRVRMGLHSGLAWPRNGDYSSLVLHQAARVVSAAHGGQILASESAVAALGSPSDAPLRPLGRFRLRDFDESVRLYEVVDDELRMEFPGVRAVPSDRHNISRHLTETIGRGDVVSALADHVEAGRVVTLVGPGGVGKTRIARDLATALAPKWDDGVWLVDLTAVNESGLVTAAIADAVGAPDRSGSDRWDDLVAHIERRNIVVILDSCEHLVATCHDVVEALLAACEDLAMITTSREPLHLPGEIPWRIEPLELPKTDDPEDVLESSAGRLFAERAVAVHPGFAVNESNAAAVAEICRQVDGLPLLLELAAAHVSALSPGEILVGIEQNLRLLRGPAGRTPDRHRTAESLLGWSYRLLDDDERTALRRLSVFPSGFTLRRAAAAATPRDRAADGDDLDPADVPHLVWSLVDRSLLTADLTANDTRYRFLETVRSYASSRLDEHGETASTAVALATSLLDELGPWHPQDRGWAGEVAAEVDTLRGLIPLIPDDREEIAQQIACTIGRWHDAEQTFRTGVRELSRYVERLTEPSPTRVAMLATLAYLHLRTGDVDAAASLVDEAAFVEQDHGAPSWDDVAVDRARGEMARRSGALEEAVAIAERALDRDLSERGQSRMYNLLGTALAALGDLRGATEALARELELNRRVGYDVFVASAHGNLAECALRLGDFPGAAKHQRQCLQLAIAQGSSAMIAFSLIVAARLAGTGGDEVTGVRLHARAERLLDEIGFALYEDDRQESDAMLATARQSIGDERFERAQEEGQKLDIPDAVSLADTVFAGMEIAADSNDSE
jgi:predicted ATPase/class 3 adenylate cyclase/tetratricopeptide (TPR) repeat protein